MPRLLDPVFAPMLREAWLTRAAAVVGVALVASGALGINLWPCPMAVSVGWPCPGCGLTRSVLAMLRGDLMLAARYHVFGPAFFGGLILFTLGTVLPGTARLRLADIVAACERKLPVVQITLTLTLLYWLVRVGYLHGDTKALLLGS